MQINKNREINFMERRTINLKASDRYSFAVMVTQLLFQVLKYKSAARASSGGHQGEGHSRFCRHQESVEEFVRFLRLPVYWGHLPFAFHR
jgi:hypothetical protein